MQWGREKIDGALEGSDSARVLQSPTYPRSLTVHDYLAVEADRSKRPSSPSGKPAPSGESVAPDDSDDQAQCSRATAATASSFTNSALPGRDVSPSYDHPAKQGMAARLEAATWRDARNARILFQEAPLLFDDAVEAALGAERSAGAQKVYMGAENTSSEKTRVDQKITHFDISNCDFGLRSIFDLERHVRRGSGHHVRRPGQLPAHQYSADPPRRRSDSRRRWEGHAQHGGRNRRQAVPSVGRRVFRDWNA